MPSSRYLDRACPPGPLLSLLSQVQILVHHYHRASLAWVVSARQPLPCTSPTGLCTGLPVGRLSSTQPTKFPQSPTRALYHPAGPGLCCVPVSLLSGGKPRPAIATVLLT